MLPTKLAQLQPELLFLERSQPVVWKQGDGGRFVVKLGNFPQQQRPHLECGHPACQTVPARLDTQRRAAGDQGAHPAYVHQVLHLRRPVGQVLHLIQKKKHRFSPAGGPRQRLPADVVGKPIGQLEKGHGQPAQRGQFIKLEPEDARERDAFPEQVINHLQLECGFADLARSAQQHRRGRPPEQPLQHGFKGPASDPGHVGHGFPAPPRIHFPDRPFQPGVEQPEQPWRTGGHHTVYEPLATRPPLPVQLVWKNWPRGASTRS